MADDNKMDQEVAPEPPPIRKTPVDDYMRPVPPLYFNENEVPNSTPPAPQPAKPSCLRQISSYPKILKDSTRDFPDDPSYRPVPAAANSNSSLESSQRPYQAPSRSRYQKPSVTAQSQTSVNSTRSRKGSAVRFDAQPAVGGREQRSSRRDRNKPETMDYLVDEVPPWYLCILLGFQHYLIMFGATAANPLAIATSLCIADQDGVTKSHLIQTIFVTSGIITFLQVTLGVRLPIVQGGTFTFVAPTLAILSLPQWKCPTAMTATLMNETTVNEYLRSNEYGEVWKSRIREIQGAIMVSSLFEVFIGFSGVMAILLRFIGPLSVAPTITLAGLSLFGVAVDYSSQQWWITLVTVLLIAAFSQYTKNIGLPCVTFKKGTGFKTNRFPVFRLFPVILAVALSWILVAILDASGVLTIPRDVVPQACKPDISTNDLADVLNKAPWFRFPYPGQWGTPTVSVAGVFGMLAGVLANMVESVGDYYACARISGATPPPIHAINRGIGVEGLGCIFAGAWGSGSGTTSYSESIGAIGITKVSSRRVIQCAAAMMVLFGVFGKLGVLFILIPRPIIGGVFIVMFGMVAAVGISNLQFVNLNSSRNLFIIGFSFFFGLKLPDYLSCNPDTITTGNDIADQIFTVLLKNSMFVGGISAFVLDNTIPGTEEERGLHIWKERERASAQSRQQAAEDAATNVPDTYDIPFIKEYISDKMWSRFVPFLPTFDEALCVIKTKHKKKRSQPRSTRRGTLRSQDGDSDSTSM